MNARRALPRWIVACALAVRGLHRRAGFPHAGSAGGRSLYVPVRSRRDRHGAAWCAERDIPAEWWSVFGSPDIDALVQARARQRARRSTRRAHASRRRRSCAPRAPAPRNYPQVDATSAPCGSASTPPRSAFRRRPIRARSTCSRIGADVSYTSTCSAARGASSRRSRADVDYQGYELEAARLTLAGNVVLTAIRQAALAAQIESTARHPRRAAPAARDRRGSGSRSVAWRGSTCRTSARWSRRPRRRWRRCARNGRRRGICSRSTSASRRRTRRIPAIRLADLRLPAELPLRLPSELVRQRPDIRANEALLHKASANVGVATADLYPKLVISGGVFVEPAQYLGRLRQRHQHLEHRRQPAAAAVPRRRVAGAQAGRRRGLRAGGGGLPAVGAAGAAERGRRAALARGRRSRVRRPIRAGGPRRRCLPDHAGPVRCGRRKPAGAARRRAPARLQADNERLQAQASRYADAAALFQALGGGWTSAPVAGAR